MWLFTRSGFFSVTRTPDDNKMQIRARVKDHLLRLKSRLGLRNKVIHTNKADYLYRIIVSEGVWLKVAAQLSLDALDYSNFKKEAAAEFGINDPYVVALHNVWAQMARLELERPNEWSQYQDRREVEDDKLWNQVVNCQPNPL